MDEKERTMQISERLMTVASFVSDGSRVADIGTDHAYVPISLMLDNRIICALAMDVREGPLARAKKHIREYQLENSIHVRLSDGLSAYQKGEADSIVISGMGGALTERILTEGAGKYEGVRELILSPQSEIFLVRIWLRKNGWQIERETMLVQDGKYYTVIRAVPGEDGEARRVEDQYGGYLLKHKHPVLLDYLLQERETIHKILVMLKKQIAESQNQAHIENRIGELTDKLLLVEEALLYYEM